MMISFFISSTFKDMQYERDILHTKVFPELNDIGKKYGQSVSFCDLRWGINTLEMSEKESTQKILKVCLNEIDKCHPYMIVILGDRYGWIPDDNSIKQAISERPFYSPQNQDISITELEIDYGVLFNQNNIDHVLFYFRESTVTQYTYSHPESSLHKRKLDDLKQRIINTPGCHYQIYHIDPQNTMKDEMQKFASLVFEDLKNLLQPEWEKQKHLDIYETDQIQHWAFLTESSQVFQERTETLKKCINIINNSSNLLITGPSGSGKSTLLSRLGMDLTNMGNRVIPVYCGLTEKTTSGLDILKYIIWILENELQSSSHYALTTDFEHDTLENWYIYLDELLDKYEETSPNHILFLIDGTNQLIRDEISENLSFIPTKKYSRIHFIISMIEQQYIPAVHIHVPLDALNFSERKAVANSLANIYHHELPTVVLDSLCGLSHAGLPLYIKLIIDRLLMMNHEDFQYISEQGDNIETITNYQLLLIKNCPSSIEDMSFFLLNHATKILGGSSLNTVLQLLSVSRKGLRLSDIDGIMKNMDIPWNQIDFLSYTKYMRTAFIFRNDGRIDFSHSSIKIGYFRKCKDLISYNTSIAKYLLSLPQDDTIRSEELVWHLMQADMVQDFYTTISEYSFYHHSEVQLKRIADDVIHYMAKNNSDWLLNSIYNFPLNQPFGFFNHFINYYVYYGLIQSYNNVKLRIQITEALLKIDVQRYTTTHSHGDLWDISIACERLAEAYRTFNTEENDDIAISYSNLCIKYRQKMLDLFHNLHSYQERKTLLQTTSYLSGISIDENVLTEQTVTQITDMLQSEILRGIGIAHKDISLALIRNNNTRIKEAMDHIQKGIAITTSILETPANNNQNQNNLDLHYMYIIASNIAMCMLNDAVYAKDALSYLNKAISLAKDIFCKSQDSEWETIYYDDLVSKVILFKQYGGDYIKQAIELSQTLEESLEKLLYRKKSTSYRNSLTRLYNALDDIYSSENANHNDALAKAYRKKCHQLAQGESHREKSIHNRQNYIHSCIKSIDDTVIHDNNDMKDLQNLLEIAYDEAYNLFTDFSSKENCQRLNQVLVSAQRVLKNLPEMTPELLEIADIETEIAIAHNQIQIQDNSEDDVRHCILTLSNCSERIQQFKELSQSVTIPEMLLQIMDCIKINLTSIKENPSQRSCEIAGLAVKLSEYLVDKFSDSLPNKDILAVSLAKYAPLCIDHDKDEFLLVNRKLNLLAKELYSETKRDKYQMMILSSQMGLMISNYQENPSEHEGELSKFLKDVLGI